MSEFSERFVMQSADRQALFHGDPVTYIDRKKTKTPIPKAILGDETTEEVHKAGRNVSGRQEQIVRYVTIITDQNAEHRSPVGSFELNATVQVESNGETLEYAVQSSVNSAAGTRQYKLLRTSAISRTRPNYDPEGS